MKNKTITVVLLFLVLFLSACDMEPTQKTSINVNDKDVTIYLHPFTIVCDKEKEMGIAYVTSYVNDGTYDNHGTGSVGGMLTPAQYEKWCSKTIDK